MGPMLKEEAFHLGTGSSGLRRIIKAGVIPLDMLQRYINKWVATAHDLFGTDSSTSAQWAYVWGVKGRWDERKKLKNEIEVDKQVLNEEGRGHYHDEIAKEVAKFNSLIADDVDFTMTIPHENFHRDIGAFGGKKCNTDGSLFEGTDEEYAAYLNSVLPTAEDEEALVELMKQQWIEDKPMSAGQIASGIGATA